MHRIMGSRCTLTEYPYRVERLILHRLHPAATHQGAVEKSPLKIAVAVPGEIAAVWWRGEDEKVSLCVINAAKGGTWDKLTLGVADDQ